MTFIGNHSQRRLRVIAQFAVVLMGLFTILGSTNSEQNDDEYALGGVVTGMNGGTLILQVNNGSDLEITSNGIFAFPFFLKTGSLYEVTVKSSSSNQICTVTNGTGTIFGTDVTNIVVSCVDSFEVGGSVSGLNGSLTLQNNGTDDLVVTSDGPFTFPVRIADGANYSVTVKSAPATQTCVVMNANGTISGADVANVAVTCADIPTDSFTVGGQITGLVGTGLTLQNNGGDNLVVNSNGAFTFPTPIPNGGTYSVTVLTNPSGPNQVCTVTGGGSGTISGANVSSVMLSCVTESYTVGGSVSGLGMGSIILFNNGGDSLTLVSNGTFAFSTPLLDQSDYSVVVVSQPAGQTCSVTNGIGTLNGADVTNVVLTCTDNVLDTVRVSVDRDGFDANSNSIRPTVSDDGRFVAFPSDASDLISGDTNSSTDIFVRDVLSGQTTRVSSPDLMSQGTLGAEANDKSFAASISGNGQFIVFGSSATNLVSNDTNGVRDIFRHNRITGETIRISEDSSGNEGDADSRNAVISADGLLVVFSSFATNLVPSDNNGVRDIFKHDTVSGMTTRVSVPSPADQVSLGIEGDLDSFVASMTADGRFIAFDSKAPNLVQNDSNGQADIFVHDSLTGETTRVSVPHLPLQFILGTEASFTSFNPVISADGQLVAFGSSASNLVLNDANSNRDIFVHNRSTGSTVRASVDSNGVAGFDSSITPSMSADGRYVTFASRAPTLVADDGNGDQDIFVRDLVTNMTTRVSLAFDGGDPEKTSSNPKISADGAFVVFSSLAGDLVVDDSGPTEDVFRIRNPF